jgi:hypothetical protein
MADLAIQIDMVRRVFAFDRMKKGWTDAHIAFYVGIAVNPMSVDPRNRKLEKAVRKASQAFAREVSGLGEMQSGVAAIGALVTYLSLAQQYGGTPDEQVWRATAEELRERLEQHGAPV